MEEKQDLEQTVEHFRHYAEVKMKLAQLDVTEKISSMVSSFVSVAFFVLLGLFTLFIISIGMAMWIGQETGNTSMGFFILAGVYVVILFVLYALRNTLIKLPILNLLIKKIFSNENN